MAQNHSNSLFLISFCMMISNLLFSIISTDSSSVHNNRSSSLLSLTLHPGSAVRSPNPTSTISTNSLFPDEFSSIDFYYARIGVGQPAQDFFLIIDTNSDVTWINCKPCDDCNAEDPVFDPTRSTTFRKLPCWSRKCIAGKGGPAGEAITSCFHGPRGNTCFYDVTYGINFGQAEGELLRLYPSSSGDLVSEALTFGRSQEVNGVGLGCSRSIGGDFGGAAGVLSLSKGPLSLPSQLKATSFSYCFADVKSKRPSTLDFNAAMPEHSIVVPMVQHPEFRAAHYHFVEITGISVAGSRLDIPPSVIRGGKNGAGGFRIDTGSTGTYLPEEAFWKLKDAFVSNTRGISPKVGGTGGWFSSLCYDLSSRNNGIPDDGTFPEVEFHFAGGGTLSLGPENCLIPSHDGRTACFSFTAMDEVPILGSRFQQGTRVTFDLAKKRIGFSKNKC